MAACNVTRSKALSPNLGVLPPFRLWTPHVATLRAVPAGGTGPFSLCSRPDDTRRQRARRPKAVPVSEREATCLGSEIWENFARAVTGEWEGATSTFEADGEVKQLPRNYVPDAYREWGIEIVDWTHMSSSIVSSEGMLVGVKRFMPTVGCEADAVAYVEDSQRSLRSLDGQEWEAKTILSDGSYSIGPRVLALQEGDDFIKHRIEACMAGDQAAAERDRVRMVYDVRRRDAKSPWEVVSIDVFKEVYVGEYQGGTNLRSCGGAAGYGDKQRTAADDIAGTWHVEAGQIYDCALDGMAFRCSNITLDGEVAMAGDGVVYLPLGVWSRVEALGNNLQVESGYLHSNKLSQTVVTCKYLDGKVTEVALKRLMRP